MAYLISDPEGKRTYSGDTTSGEVDRYNGSLQYKVYSSNQLISFKNFTDGSLVLVSIRNSTGSAITITFESGVFVSNTSGIEIAANSRKHFSAIQIGDNIEVADGKDIEEVT